RRLTELHGGSVHAKSNFGEGSSFSIVLPWVAPQTERDPGSQIKPPSHTKPLLVYENNEDYSQADIMIVDDNEVNIQMISDYLSMQKYNIFTARNGWEFLETVSKIRPQIILMDIQMPGLDGLTLISRLRNHPDSRIANTPVIAMTALAMPGDREKCLAAGATEYVCKPVKLKELVNIITNFYSPSI
ncbi:MAG: response regulator, partial [Anaerolineae bacterium]|nr:response regulator [Anaerolineae bacterium]